MESLCLRLPVKFSNDAGQFLVNNIVVELACACIGMSAAAVAEAELADINFAYLVDDGLSDHDSSVLLPEAPRNMNADFNLRPHSIDHETVSCIDRFERTKV